MPLLCPQIRIRVCPCYARRVLPWLCPGYALGMPPDTNHGVCPEIYQVCPSPPGSTASAMFRIRLTPTPKAPAIILRPRSSRRNSNTFRLISALS